MPDKAYEQILDRETPGSDIKKHLQGQVDLLIQLVNYGSNLIPRCFVSSNKKIEDIVILGVLLKHFVAMLDAVQILLSEGAVLASTVQVRALLEASLSIDWILKDKTLKRAKHYFVYHMRRRLYNNKKLLKEDSKHAFFLKGLMEISKELGSNIAALESTAREDIEQIEKLLSGKEYKEINEAFLNIEKRKERKGMSGIPNWYVLENIQSIGQLAREVGRQAQYDVLYSQFSETSHSTNVKDHLYFKKDKVEFEPIRYLKEIGTMFSIAFSMAIYTFQIILKHYRYSELDNFARKYVQEWQKPFMNIPKVNIESIISKEI